MDQTLPNFKNIIEPEAIAEILEIPTEWITSTKLAPQVVSTGLNDLMIPIATREQLFSIKLDDKKISSFEKKHGLDSFQMFTFDTVEGNCVANSRNCDPLHGIHEESATGSATGALACYLYHYGKVTQQQLHKLLFEQGYSMGKPSQIAVSLVVKEKEVGRVQVGGNAQLIGEKGVSL